MTLLAGGPPVSAAPATEGLPSRPTRKVSHMTGVQERRKGWGTWQNRTCGPFPSASLPLPALPRWCPTSVPWVCIRGPLSLLLLFLCFSVCFHPTPFHFFPGLLTFFYDSPSVPTHDLVFLYLAPQLGPKHPPPSAVSQAAKLPMSIIIIGVGQAEFDGESLSGPPVLLQRLRPWGMALP